MQVIDETLQPISTSSDDALNYHIILGKGCPIKAINAMNQSELDAKPSAGKTCNRERPQPSARKDATSAKARENQCK